MDVLNVISMLFGAALAVTGILLFTKRGAQGRNTIKVYGIEFQLAGSSLVIFVVGVLLFALPIYLDNTGIPTTVPVFEEPEVSPVDQLTRVIQQGTASERRAAAKDLGEYGRPAVEPLMQALSDNDLLVVLAAIHSLENIGRSASSACPNLSRLTDQMLERWERPLPGGEIIIQGRSGPQVVAEAILAANFHIGC